MEFLKSILGDELYGQVEAKINEHNTSAGDKDKQIKLVNINSGEYVSKEKYNTLKTQADGLDKQVKEANATIESYKGMDIEGIKKSADDWKTKYETDTAQLQEQMRQQTYDYEAERYLAKYKFSSELAKKAALTEFREKKFQLQDGAFLGADDYMKQMKEANPTAFVDEEANQSQQKYQTFVRGTSGGYKPQQVTDERAILDQKYANNPYYRK